jgi:hypothetical protein
VCLEQVIKMREKMREEKHWRNRWFLVEKYRRERKLCGTHLLFVSPLVSEESWERRCIFCLFHLYPCLPCFCYGLVLHCQAATHIYYGCCYTYSNGDKNWGKKKKYKSDNCRFLNLNYFMKCCWVLLNLIFFFSFWISFLCFLVLSYWI